MATSHAYAPHLASLRRYATAACGSPERADTVVFASLTELVEEGGAPAHGLAPRLVMYRAFYRMCVSLATMIDGSVHAGDQSTSATLPSSEWMTFLLLTMESFSPDEAALVTGQSLRRV